MVEMTQEQKARCLEALQHVRDKNLDLREKANIQAFSPETQEYLEQALFLIDILADIQEICIGRPK